MERIEHFEVRILRRDTPLGTSYWQTFRLTRDQGLNVTGVLQRIAAHPQTVQGEFVAPVAYDANCLEEVCGACTMLINGRVRQACSASVDRLLEDSPGRIELSPMGKFPVVRDLVVDRRRLFRALEKLEAWIPVDGYCDQGPGPRQSQESQQRAYPLSQCMSCGCCLEACPQYAKVEARSFAGETPSQFQVREAQAYDRVFIGAQAMSQVVLVNSSPIGTMSSARRVEALIAPGGIQNCGKAGNCQAVCPKGIPLMTSWARAGRAATIHFLRKFLDG